MKHLVIPIYLLIVVNCSNILIINSSPGPSALTTTLRLVEVLVNGGHQVTGINVIPHSSLLENYTTINVPVIEFDEEAERELFEETKYSSIENAQSMLDYGLISLESLFVNKEVQTLLKKSEGFDVVIVNCLYNYAVFGIAHHFKAPLILLSSFSSKTTVNDLVANPAPSSYVPYIRSSRTSSMDLWERLQNFIEGTYVDFLKHFVYLPRHKEIFKKYLKSDAKLDDITYNISLMLLNTHSSIALSSPRLPNMIEIGGYHLKPPKRLPKDFQNFLDKAEEGAIIFSLGTILNPKYMEIRKLEEIIKAFSKIKQKVLWKFPDNTPSLPPNVKAVKWFPQNDLLAHKNVKLFITHGGVLSIIEAVNYGVPLIGIPIFGDQGSNIAAAESHGYALKISMGNLTEENLLWSINEIIENPKYKKAAEFRSSLFHDRLVKPTDEALFWIEHVIRHRGAIHLRSPGLDLVWYKREMVDIFIFSVIIFIAFCYISFIFFKTLVKKLK